MAIVRVAWLPQKSNHFLAQIMYLYQISFYLLKNKLRPMVRAKLITIIDVIGTNKLKLPLAIRISPGSFPNQANRFGCHDKSKPIITRMIPITIIVLAIRKSILYDYRIKSKDS